MSRGATWDRRISIGGHEMAYNDMLFWPGLTCGYHLPGTVAPLGLTKAGLPLGVQIAGRPWRDNEVVAAMLAVETEVSRDEGFPRTPLRTL